MHGRMPLPKEVTFVTFDVYGTLIDSDTGIYEAFPKEAERDGPIVPVHVAPYPLEFLVDEVSLSVNTAAAGGNASLMTIG